MTVTLTTSNANASTPAALRQWLTLWWGDGSANAGQWAGLVGPPGAAAGDTWPTRPGDRSHPTAPSTATVEDTRAVVVLASAATVASLDRYTDEFITRWFAPGTIAAPLARRVDGRPTVNRAPRHTGADGSVTWMTRPESTAGAAGVGALVLYLDGASWRPAFVAAVT